MALGYAEVRIETTGAPGTFAGAASGFATKTIYLPVLNLEFHPNPAMLFRDDELRNLREPLQFITEEFTPTYSFETRLYPDSAGFLFKAWAGAPVTTVGDGIITDLGTIAVPAGAFRHRWTAPYETGTQPTSLMYRLAYTEEPMYFELRGATVEKIELGTPDTGGCRAKISGQCMFISRVADPALTPAYESLSIAPFLRQFASLTWLGSTAVTETVDVSLDKAAEQTRTFGGGSAWPNLLEFAEGVPVVSGTITKRRMANADWDALLAATRFTSLIGWVHTSFAVGAYPYKIYIQGPSTSAAYTSGDVDPLMNKRRHGAKFDFKITSSGTAGSSILEVDNATASYA